MPNTKSAKKAFRQNTKRKKINLEKKRGMKNAVRQYKNLISEGKTDEAKNILPKTYKTFDKMAKVGLIKKNKANRMKSRLAKKLPKTKKAAS